MPVLCAGCPSRSPSTRQWCIFHGIQGFFGGALGLPPFLALVCRTTYTFQTRIALPHPPFPPLLSSSHILSIATMTNKRPACTHCALKKRTFPPWSLTSHCLVLTMLLPTQSNARIRTLPDQRAYDARPKESAVNGRLLLSVAGRHVWRGELCLTN